MRAILSVSRATFRESIRNRTVLGVFLAALGLVTSAMLLAELALDQRERVILDWSLFCLSVFGLLLAVLIGVNLVHKEIRRKTLYVVLSRPFPRWKFVLGKYLGLVLTLLVAVLILTLALLVMLWTEHIAMRADLFLALLTIFLEILLVGSIAVFFASFSSPYLAGFFTLGLFLTGRSLPVLDKLADKIDGGVLHGLLKALFYVLPDLSVYNLGGRVVHNVPIAWAEVGRVTLYGSGYLITLLLVAMLVFSRRDLT